MQFKRIYKLVLGSPGVDGVVLSNVNDDGTYNPNAIKVTFDIDKDTTKKTNKSKITIYNLSDDTLDKLEKSDLVVELWAGYHLEQGLKRIFLGYAIEINTKMENDGKDVVIEIQACDGQVALRDSIISVGYPIGTSTKTIINGIASNMGLSLFTSDDIEYLDYPNGFSFVGKTKDALDVVCNTLGASWSVQNDVLQLIMSDGTTGARGLVFSADSGLIGFPERVVRSAYATAKKAETKVTSTRKKRKTKKKVERKQKKFGWKIKTLLAPTANPGDAIRVESQVVTGWFKVESLKHSGDIRGNDWITEFELIEVMLDDE